jgi:deoxyribodipyrimidine photolyase-like uncharacterized protein
MKATVWILGDQLLRQHPVLKAAEMHGGRDQVVMLMVESAGRARRLPYQQKNGIAVQCHAPLCRVSAFMWIRSGLSDCSQYDRRIESTSSTVLGFGFDRKQHTNEQACPFNYLYCNFISSHEATLRENPRMGRSGLGLRTSDDAERLKIKTSAGSFWKSFAK